MGFKENLEDVFGHLKQGAGGLFAPVKSALGLGQDLIFNTFQQDEWTGAAVQDTVGRFVGTNVEGVKDVYQGFGAKFLIDKLPWLKSGLKKVFDETELLWNHEFQEQNQDEGWALRQLEKVTGEDYEPGDVSMSRALGTGFGMMGQAQRLMNEGQNPLNDPSYNAERHWEKAKTFSPGQMAVESFLDIESLPPEVQWELRNSAGYVTSTGVIDGLTRWQADPIVVAGKGVKKFGETAGHFVGVESLVNKAGKISKAIEKSTGHKLLDVEDVRQGSRAYDATVGPALKEGDNMYLVMDSDEARAAGLWDDASEVNLRDGQGNINEFSPVKARSDALLSEAKKQLPSDSPLLEWAEGGQIYHYIDLGKDIDVSTRKATELFDFFLEGQGKKAGVNKVRWILNPENPKLPNPNDLKTMYKLIDENWDIWVQSNNPGKYKAAQFGDDLLAKAAREGIDPGRIGEFGRSTSYEGRFYDMSKIRAKEIFTELAFRKLELSYPGSGSFTSRMAQQLGKSIDEGEKGKIIFKNKDEALAAAKADGNWRKANQKTEASLGQFNVENPSVVVEINPQGLPVIVPKWDADGGWLITDINRIEKSQIISKQLHTLADLEDAGDLPLAFYSSEKGMQSPRLFENLDEARAANEKITNTYKERGSEQAEKLISNEIMLNNEANTGLLTELSNHKRIKQAVEIMEGKKSAGLGKARGTPMTALEIEKYFFKNVSSGDELSFILSRAKGTEAKMDVLLSAMGVKNVPKSIKGVPGYAIDDLYRRNIELQQMKTRINEIKKALKENEAGIKNVSEDAMPGLQAVQDTVTEGQKAFRVEYKRRVGDKLEDLSDGELNTLAEIDEFIESQFVHVPLSTTVDEFLKMHPKEAEKAFLNLELQNAWLKKAHILAGDELRQAERLAIVDDWNGVLKNVPYPSLGKRIQYNIRTSNRWNQGGGYPGRAVRSITEFTPKNWLNMSDSKSYIQIERYLKDANARFNKIFTPEEVAKWTDEYLASEKVGDKFELALKMQEEVIARIAKEKGMDASDINNMVNEMKSGIGEVQAFLKSRRYGPPLDPEIQKVLRPGDELKSAIDKNMDMFEYVDPHTGLVHMHTLPNFGTQLASWIPFTDLRLLEKELAWAQGWKSKFGMTRSRIIAEELGDGLMSVWRPSVLIRGGWSVRYLMDEIPRIFAKGIAMSDYVISLSKTPFGFGKKVFFNGELTKSVKNGEAIKATGQIVGNLITLPIKIPAMGLVATSKVLAPFIKFMPSKREISKLMDRVEPMEDLVSARAGFTSPADSLFDQFSPLIMNETTALMNKWKKKRRSGQFVEQHLRMPDGSFNPNYPASWYRALNFQMANDPIGRITLNALKNAMDEVVKLYPDTYDIEKLLVLAQKTTRAEFRRYFNTSKGKAYVEQMPWRGRNSGPGWIDNWADDTLDMTAQYTSTLQLGISDSSRDFLATILKGELKLKHLDDIPSDMRPPIIHGEEMSMVFGTGNVISQSLKAFLKEGFEGFGRIPTDVLSRNPLFRAEFAYDLRKRIDMAVKQGKKEWTIEEVNAMTQSAKKKAIEETQRYMYNLAESPRATTGPTKFVMPFLSANVEILKVWGALIRQNPAIIPKANLIWESPSAAVNTEAGMFEGAGGKYAIIKPNPYSGEDAFTFRFSSRITEDPEFYDKYWVEASAKKLGITKQQARYILEGTAFTFDKKSLNMVTQNPFGSGGPIVQIGTNEYAIRNPEIEKEKIGEFVLSYGAKSGVGTWDRILKNQSPSIRNFGESMDFNPDYQGKKQKIYHDYITYHHVMVELGEIEPVGREQLLAEADALWNLYAWVQYYSPAAPAIESPLAPYKAAFQALIDEHGPSLAIEMFLKQYGKEYRAVTYGKTQSLTGLPPTLEAEEARKKFSDIILKHPEFARTIVGDIPTGDFSSTVYAAQLSSTVDRDFKKKAVEYHGAERTHVTFGKEDLLPNGQIRSIDVKAGWEEYGRLRDWYDSEIMLRRINKNTVKRKDPQLYEEYSSKLEQIKDEHPGWAEEKDIINLAAKSENLETLEEILFAVMDPNITNDPTTRPDMLGLSLYIDLREKYKIELDMMGSGSINNQNAARLKYAFDWDVQKVLEQYPGFASIYYRYLEDDDLSY